MHVLLYLSLECMYVRMYVYVCMYENKFIVFNVKTYLFALSFATLHLRFSALCKLNVCKETCMPYMFVIVC